MIVFMQKKKNYRYRSKTFLLIIYLGGSFSLTAKNPIFIIVWYQAAANLWQIQKIHTGSNRIMHFVVFCI